MILKELGLLSLVTGEEVKAGSFRQQGCRDRGKEGESQEVRKGKAIFDESLREQRNFAFPPRKGATL